MPGDPMVTTPPALNGDAPGSPGLATRVYGPTNGIRVALLHGFTQSGRSWDVVGGALAASGREVMTVDLPGHGGSGAIRANLPESADLVTAAVGSAVYVGYSMGGRVALHAALRSPGAVLGLVLIGATAGIEDEPGRVARREADERLASDLERDGVDAFLARWLANPMFATLPADSAGLTARRSNTVPGLAASLRLCGTGTQETLWDQLASIACPVAVLAGSLDEKFTTIGKQLVASIGEGARFATVGGAGHAAHLERPDAAIAAIEEAIARCTARN